MRHRATIGHAAGKERNSEKCPFKDATPPLIDCMRNPMHGPDRKADRVGLSRYFSLSEIAALAAIIGGVNVVTAIARTFDIEQPSMLKACRSLEDGLLISRRPKIIETRKGQRAAWAHELTRDGREIVEILKKDRIFVEFIEWVEKHPENPGKFEKMDK